MGMLHSAIALRQLISPLRFVVPAAFNNHHSRGSY